MSFCRFQLTDDAHDRAAFFMTGHYWVNNAKYLEIRIFKFLLKFKLLLYYSIEDQRTSGNPSFRTFSGHSNIRLYK